MITNYMNNCILCGRPDPEWHHVFGGVRNRSLADQDKLILPLCRYHHTGKESVHMQKELKQFAHMVGQLEWMLDQMADDKKKQELIEQFRKRYGESYL